MSYHILGIGIGLALTVATAPAQASNASEVKVTFRTLSCQGDIGFGSVNADRVYRIKATKCNANDPVPQVHQVLVKRGPAGSSYDVFTVSADEAETLLQKVETYQEDKREALRNSDRLIFERTR